MVAFDLMTNTAVKWATILPPLMVLYFCFKEHQTNDLQNYLPFSRIVKISWLMGLFIAIPIAIFSYVLYTYIAPNVIEQMIEMVRTSMENQANSDPEITEKIIKWQTKYLLNATAISISTLIAVPIMTLLEGMLVGAFIHKAIPRFK
jgi:H+/gluconate symporter-like permease